MALPGSHLISRSSLPKESLRRRHAQRMARRRSSGHSHEHCADEIKESFQGKSSVQVFPNVPKHPPSHGPDHVAEAAKKVAQALDRGMHGESEARVFPEVPKYSEQVSSRPDPVFETLPELARELGKSMQGRSEAHIFPRIPPQYGTRTLHIRDTDRDDYGARAGSEISSFESSGTVKRISSSDNSATEVHPRETGPRPYHQSKLPWEEHRRLLPPDTKIASPYTLSSTDSARSHQSHQSPGSFREDSSSTTLGPQHRTQEDRRASAPRKETREGGPGDKTNSGRRQSKTSKDRSDAPPALRTQSKVSTEDSSGISTPRPSSKEVAQLAEPSDGHGRTKTAKLVQRPTSSYAASPDTSELDRVSKSSPHTKAEKHRKPTSSYAPSVDTSELDHIPGNRKQKPRQGSRGHSGSQDTSGLGTASIKKWIEETK